MPSTVFEIFENLPVSRFTIHVAKESHGNVLIILISISKDSIQHDTWLVVVVLKPLSHCSFHSPGGAACIDAVPGAVHQAGAGSKGEPQSGHKFLLFAGGLWMITCSMRCSFIHVSLAHLRVLTQLTTKRSHPRPYTPFAFRGNLLIQNNWSVIIASGLTLLGRPPNFLKQGNSCQYISKTLSKLTLKIDVEAIPTTVFLHPANLEKSWKIHKNPTNFIKNIGNPKRECLGPLGRPKRWSCRRRTRHRLHRLKGPGWSAVHHFTHFWGKKNCFFYEVFLGFLKFLLSFFGIFLLKLFHFRCVAFLILFIGSFSLIFRTRWYNSGLSDGSPLGGKASPWRFGKRKSHLRISRKEPKQLTWRAGWERERLILNFISAKLSCPLLDFVSSRMRIFWDPSKAWFICLGIFQVDLGVLWHDLPCFHVSSSPVLIWMRSEPTSCVWPSDILWAYDEFPCSHLCITFLLEGLSVYPVCSIFEKSGGQPESSPIKSSTKWPLTKMTSCSNIEVGAQLHTNLRRFIDQSAVRTFKISKETIQVKATFYTVNNHTWHCDILYHHLRMISNACLYWLHLYLLEKTDKQHLYDVYVNRYSRSQHDYLTGTVQTVHVNPEI